MSFGFSVGDIVTVLNVAWEIRQRLIGSPSEFRALRDDVNNFWLLLEEASSVLPSTELTDAQKKNLHSILESGNHILELLRDLLHKYMRLDTQPAKLTDKAKRVWKKLRFEPDDVAELRARLSLQLGLLGAFNDSVTRTSMGATEQALQKLILKDDDIRRQHIVDWISPYDYSTLQRDFIDERQEGTGQWLLKSSEYEKWLSGIDEKMICPGMPGAGKTLMVATVIDDLEKRFLAEKDIALAYIYFSYNRAAQQNIRDLLSSLLKQLVQQSSAIPAPVNSLYEKHYVKRTKPTTEEILSVLRSITNTFETAFFLVDALDECHTESRDRLLTTITQLRTRQGRMPKLFATSRYIPEAMSQFGNGISLEIRATDEDVGRYIEGQMLSQPSNFPCLGSPLYRLIKDEVSKSVDGLFLLARLHLESLRYATTAKQLKATIRTLPRGNNVLDATYKQALDRIQDQHEHHAALARQVLGWLVYAKRPLTTLELQHALAIEVGESATDPDAIPELRLLISACAGLVTVDHESDVIRLVHYTTQEFFEREKDSSLPSSTRGCIASACITYLSYEEFATGACLDDCTYEKRLMMHPFLHYAAMFCLDHVVEASSDILNRMSISFLGHASKVASHYQVRRVGQPPGYPNYSKDYRSKRLNGLHFVAFAGGSRGLVEVLIQSGCPADQKDALGRTPLSWAAQSGNTEVFETLLKIKDVTADSRDYSGRSVLFWAAAVDNMAAAQLLLARDDVHADSQDNWGRSVLSVATRRGNIGLAQLLLARDHVLADSEHDIDSGDNRGRSVPTSHDSMDTDATTGLPASVADALASNNVAAIYDAVKAVVVRKLANLILVPEEKVEEDVELSAIGMDSLLAVEVRTYFRQTLKIDVHVYKLLGGTVGSVVKEITGRLKEKFSG